MKQNFRFDLTLTIDELINFFGIAYGSSLANATNAQGAKEVYVQLAQNAESLIIETDPNKIELLTKVKEHIKEQISKMNKLN